MTTLKATTYPKLNDLIENSRSGTPTIGNNTKARRGPEGTILVRYHNTDIVRLHEDGRIFFNFGGWDTISTKLRINQFIPGRVYHDRRTLMHDGLPISSLDWNLGNR